jgi:hypothetical protein
MCKAGAHSTTPTYTVGRGGPAREPSWSAFWLQKPSILRAFVREEDAGGREAGAQSTTPLCVYDDDVFYLFLQKQKIGAELHIYLEYWSTYYKAVGVCGGEVEDMCYERLRAEAGVN